MKIWIRAGFISLFTILIGCSKDLNSLNFKSYKYKIYLNNDLIINKVEYFESEKLNYTEFINNKMGLVEVTQESNTENFYRKTFYYLNSNNQADSSIDSVYYNSNFRKSKTFYEYDTNGYKINSKYVASNIFILNYHYQDGNNINITFPSGCSDYFEFDNRINKINLDPFFLGDIIGRKNTNLLESIRSNCHYAPSTAPPKSRFAYSLDEKGFVVKKTEDWRSDHQDDQDPIKEIRITKYEYIFE